MNDSTALSEWIKFLTHMTHWSKAAIEDSTQALVFDKIMTEGLRLDVPPHFLPYTADHDDVVAKRKQLLDELNKDVNDTVAKKTQFITSLKFHHAQTLSEMPLDLALKALVKAWQDSQVRTRDCNNGQVLDPHQTLSVNHHRKDKVICL